MGRIKAQLAGKGGSLAKSCNTEALTHRLNTIYMVAGLILCHLRRLGLAKEESRPGC